MLAHKAQDQAQRMESGGLGILLMFMYKLEWVDEEVGLETLVLIR